jgi:thioredoxin-dependent peroxiredoxin
MRLEGYGLPILSWLFTGPLATGSMAPEFALPDQSGTPVSLSSLRGTNVVLVFYPGDDTPICRKQLCEFRDAWSSALERNTRVLGINPQDAASHRQFLEKFGFPFQLLVDKDQAVARLYNASGLLVRRTVYLVGPDGVIRYASRGKPAPAEVLAAAQ